MATPWTSTITNVLDKYSFWNIKPSYGQAGVDNTPAPYAPWYYAKNKANIEQNRITSSTSNIKTIQPSVKATAPKSTWWYGTMDMSWDAYLNKKVTELVKFYQWKWLSNKEATEVAQQFIPSMQKAYKTWSATISPWEVNIWERIEQKIWTIKNPAIKDIVQKGYNINPITPIKQWVDKLIEWSTNIWSWAAKKLNILGQNKWQAEEWVAQFKKWVVQSVSWWIQTGFNIVAPVATQALNFLWTQQETAVVPEKLWEINDFVWNNIAKIPWISDFRNSLDPETQQELDSTLWLVALMWVTKWKDAIKWIPEFINRIKTETPEVLRSNLGKLNESFKNSLQDTWYKAEFWAKWTKVTEYTPAPGNKAPSIEKWAISDLQKALRPRQEVKEWRIVRKQADIERQYSSVANDFQWKWQIPENVRDFVDKAKKNQTEIYTKYINPEIAKSWVKIDLNPVLNKIKDSINKSSETLAPEQVRRVNNLIEEVQRKYKKSSLMDLEELKQTTNALTDWRAVGADKVYNSALKDLSSWIWKLMDNALDTIKWEKLSYWKNLYWDYAKVLTDANKTLVRIEWQSPVWLFEWLWRLQGLKDIVGWTVEVLKWEPGGVPKITSWATSIIVWKKIKLANDPNNLVKKAFSKQKPLKMAEVIKPKDEIKKTSTIKYKK